MKVITSSVIICTRNRPADILICLHSLAKQTVCADEIIIIDSSDAPLESNNEFQQLFTPTHFGITHLVYRHTAPGLPYQRNVGISLATQEVVHFLDDDVILTPSYLQIMNETFANHPEYAGGMGTVTNIPVPLKRNWFRAMRHLFLLQRDYASGNFTWSGMPTHAYGLHELKSVAVLGGCCMAYRRSVFVKHLFDEKLERYAFMEDCDFSCRVWRDALLFYNPHAQLEHHPSKANRDGIVDNRAMYIKNYSYLFFKNFYPRNRLKVIAYAWSVTGLFVEAAITRNSDYLKGYCKGLKQYYSAP